MDDLSAVPPFSMLRIDDAEGWRYETRDRAMRVVFSRVLVEQLEDARNASSENGEWWAKTLEALADSF